MTPLEVDYSPSSMIDDIDVHLDEYASRSAAVRDVVAWVPIRYGTGEREVVDVFGALDAPVLHVFFHGGYWQQLGREDASFSAASFTARGVAYAAAGYTLAPEADLGEIVEQARNAVVALATQFDGRIVVSGSSAGAHLAAMVAVTDWPSRGFDQSPIAGLVLMSGIYDLLPLIDTYVNDALGLDETTARRLSPLGLIEDGSGGPQAVVAVGEIETDAFRTQSAVFASRLQQRGWPVTFIDVDNRNHFDIVFDLAEASTVLGGAVHAMEADLTR